MTQQKDGPAREAATGYVQPPSPEHTPQGGPALLAQLSALSGGRALASVGPGTPAAQAEAPAQPARELWPWLLLAAALLWPLEIAVRRGDPALRR